MDMTLYTSKHEAIKQTLAEIKSLSASAQQKAEEISKSMGKLSVVVQMHLASEDKYLYPELLKSSLPSTRKTTESYMTEMKQIECSFKTFVSDYRTAEAIRKNPDDFLSAFTQIDNALRLRMGREENELYLLA